MIYAKNLPVWERWSRAAAGIALMIYAMVGVGGGLVGWTLIGAGVVAVLTAFFGFCPMCAMIGRRTQV